MILLSIILSLSTVLSFWIASQEPYSSLSGKLGLGCFYAIGATVVIGGFFMYLSMFVSAFHITKEPIQFTANIANMADTSRINGKFAGGVFAIRGSINQDEYFSFYQKHDDGALTLEKLPANMSRVFQDATPETARVEQALVRSYCIPKWWFICAYKPKTELQSVVFHVPEGSVADSFVLDAH